MDKFLPNFSSLLTADNPEYASLVVELWNWWLKNDEFGSNAIGIERSNNVVKFNLVAKEGGVWCGSDELEIIFGSNETIVIDYFFVDGSSFKSGDILLSITGTLSDLARFERPIINLVSRMSGIATDVNNLSNQIKNIRLAATRKSLWGLIDKKSVAVGGGLTHRLSFEQALMVKDNDWHWFSSLWSDANARLDFVNNLKGYSFVEFEVETIDEFEAFLSIAEDYKTYDLPPLILMFDNFTIDDLRLLLPSVRSFVIVEVSGGITKESLVSFDMLGIDYVSMGMITRDARSLDFSMRIV